MPRLTRTLPLLLACALSLTFGRAQPAAAPAAPAEAARLRAALHKELAALADAYNASLPPLAENYVLALKRLSSRLKDGNAPADADAVKKEAARFLRALAAEPDPFETVPELTADAVSASIESLRLLQLDYVARRSAADLTRDGKAKDLAVRCADALEQLAARLLQDGQAQNAADAKKEATRIRVALQRKDAANRLFEEAGARCRPMPPAPDLASLKERAQADPPAVRNLNALTLNDLPPAVQAALLKPLEYDKDWPPEIVKWKFEGTGNYSHDFSLYNLPGQPDELGLFACPKTLRACVRGTKKASTVNFDGKAVTWLGKAMSWRLNDSRDLVCKVVFSTKRPALKENAGPAACVAVYSLSENNRLIASLSVPLAGEVTSLRLAKHFSYNRLNIVWEDGKRKRGFTIPDHTPLRVVVGVAAFAPGETVDALIEIAPCGPLGDMW